jgi:hypothetical protein
MGFNFLKIHRSCAIGNSQGINDRMSPGKKSDKINRRQQIQARQRRQKLVTTFTWGGLGIAVIALVGLLIWRAVRPAAGEAVAVPVNSSQHIAVGTPPGPYNTDPPAGGVHYDETLPTKFYEEADVATLPDYPEGYLVHNLEHGYVIFWYNCAVVDEAGCTLLKQQIQQVMDDFDGVKLIAFPWKSLDVPVVMTSWGRLQRFETFNPAQARAFVKANRNHAPEPNAP